MARQRKLDSIQASIHYILRPCSATPAISFSRRRHTAEVHSIIRPPKFIWRKISLVPGFERDQRLLSGFHSLCSARYYSIGTFSFSNILEHFTMVDYLLLTSKFQSSAISLPVSQTRTFNSGKTEFDCATKNSR